MEIPLPGASLPCADVPDAASPLAGKRRGPESMSDAESSGTAEAATANSLALVPLTPDHSHACGGAHVSTSSLDHHMQHHRLSLQTSTLLARACSEAFGSDCSVPYTLFND